MMPGMRYDVVVIGSGFGGSVAALRLAEKGYSVAVLEAGRRFADDEFPRDLLAAAPLPLGAELGCYGIQRIDLLRRPPQVRRGVLVLSGAGVGGGSLVYANTLYEPLPRLLRRPAVARHHRLAGRAGAPLRPGQADAGRVDLRTETTGRPGDASGSPSGWASAHTFHPTPVGVHIGSGPGERCADPYFGGAGPERHRLHRTAAPA